MNRKQFIQSVGGECRNWTWSWSFVNHDERQVLFGLWDTHDEGHRGLILGKDWHTSPRGHKQPGYTQALEHISLVGKGYRLLTFPIALAPKKVSDDPLAPSTISTFSPVLTPKQLVGVGGDWFAVPQSDR